MSSNDLTDIWGGSINNLDSVFVKDFVKWVGGLETVFNQI